MRGLALMLIATCLAATPGAAAAASRNCPKCDLPGYADSSDSAANRRAAEYEANRVQIAQLTRQRDSLNRRIAYLQRDLQALLDWQQRCRAAPSACPPRPGPPLPMVGMAPGHVPPAVPQISLAMLQQQRATIARLREEIRSRAGLVGRLESRIAALRTER